MSADRAKELIQECLNKVDAGLITERFDLWHDMREWLGGIGEGVSDDDPMFGCWPNSDG